MKRNFLAILLVALLVFTSCTSIKTEVENVYIPVEEEVTIKGEKYDIPAIVTLPEGMEKAPLIIMLHGTASDKNEAGGAYSKLSPILAENGFASIRFDFPGCGESTADYTNYSNKTAVRDVEDVLSYAKESGKFDMDRVAIMGWSQGGTDALVAAGELDGTFKSVLTWAGALTGSLSTMFSEEQKNGAYQNGFFVYDPGFRAPLNVSKEWFEDLYAYNVDEIVKKISAPICSIHGSLDDTVPLSDSEYVQAVAQNPASRLEIIEGTDHLYGVFSGDDTFFNILADLTLSWFEETL